MRTAVVALALAALLYATKAPAHSWYEPSCCSGFDCAPVEDGVVVENPRTGAVTVLSHTLDRADPRVRLSRDDQDHVCQSPSGKLLCVYLKPKGN